MVIIIFRLYGNMVIIIFLDEDMEKMKYGYFFGNMVIFFWKI